MTYDPNYRIKHRRVMLAAILFLQLVALAVIVFFVVLK